MATADYDAIRAWLDFDEQNRPDNDSLRDVSYGGAPISRDNLRGLLKDYEAISASYRDAVSMIAEIDQRISQFDEEG